MDWTPERDEELRRLAPLGYKAAIRELGCTHYAVFTRASRLGFSFGAGGHPGAGRGQRWTPEQDEKLRELAAQGSVAVAAATGRSHKAIRGRAALLGVRVAILRGGTEIAQGGWGAAKTAAKKIAQREPPAARLLRRERERPAVEWCRCGAPVSNWDDHCERTGHTRWAMLGRTALVEERAA